MADGDNQPSQQPFLDENFAREAQRQLERLRTEFLVKTRDYRRIADERRQIRTQINALCNLLGIDPASSWHGLPTDPEDGVEPPSPPTGSRSESALLIAERLLQERSPGEVHYDDVVDAVRQSGISLPKGRAANDTLARWMKADPRSRFSRGERRAHVVLADDYPDARPV